MRVTGTCYMCFTFDVGFAVSVSHVERLIAEESLGQTFKRPRRAPEASLLPRHATRVMQRGQAIKDGRFESDPSVEITLWEFGAATVTYRAAIDAELADLVPLADELWDHAALMGDSRRRAEQLVLALGSAIDKPALSQRATCACSTASTRSSRRVHRVCGWSCSRS